MDGYNLLLLTVVRRGISACFSKEGFITSFKIRSSHQGSQTEPNKGNNPETSRNVFLLPQLDSFYYFVLLT